MTALATASIIAHVAPGPRHGSPPWFSHAQLPCRYLSARPSPVSGRSHRTILRPAQADLAARPSDQSQPRAQRPAWTFSSNHRTRTMDARPGLQSPPRHAARGRHPLRPFSVCLQLKGSLDALDAWSRIATPRPGVRLLHQFLLRIASDLARVRQFARRFY